MIIADVFELMGVCLVRLIDAAACVAASQSS
jgi:hypothetical protein